MKKEEENEEGEAVFGGRRERDRGADGTTFLEIKTKQKIQSIQRT